MGNGFTEQSVVCHDIFITKKITKEVISNKNVALFSSLLTATVAVLAIFLFLPVWFLGALVYFLAVFTFLVGIRLLFTRLDWGEAKNNICEDVSEKSGNRVIKIVCGGAHNLVLFSNGNLWGWGSNNNGQLGRVPLGNILRPTLLFRGVETVTTRNNHTLLLCNEGVPGNPSRYLYCMGDNTFAQLGNFDKIRYAEPVKIRTDYLDIATINGISLGMRKDKQGNQIFQAWGLFAIEESIREENEDISKTSMPNKVAKIISSPKLVDCRSFNDFVERYASVTYFWVEANESSSFRRTENDPAPRQLIDPAELMTVQYLSQNQKPIRGVMNVHIGTKNNFSLMSDCSIGSGGSISMESISLAGSMEARPQSTGLFSKLGKRS